MQKLVKNIAFIIIFAAFLFSPAIYPAQSKYPLLNNSIVFENGKKGVDVNISAYDDDRNIDEDDASEKLTNVSYYKIGAKIYDVADLKNINFYVSLLDAYIVNRTPPDAPKIIILRCLDFKSSNQINTYVDWLKLGYGIGSFLGKDNDPRKHIFIYSGLGFTKAAFNDTTRDFKNMTFSGVKPFIGLQFRIGSDNFNLNSQSEIKAIVGDKTLYEINPKIELSYDVLSLMDRSKEYYYPILNINFRTEYSKLIYKSFKNDSFKYVIGITYTWGENKVYM